MKKKDMYKIKILVMRDDYCWRKTERTFKTREYAQYVSERVSRNLNHLLNNQRIKDYRVEITEESEE